MSAGALPQIPLGELTALPPDPLAGFKGTASWQEGNEEELREGLGEGEKGKEEWGREGKGEVAGIAPWLFGYRRHIKMS